MQTHTTLGVPLALEIDGSSLLHSLLSKPPTPSVPGPLASAEELSTVDPPDNFEAQGYKKCLCPHCRREGCPKSYWVRADGVSAGPLTGPPEC